MTEIKTGFMHKCGKSVKSWKRRWFVLKANGYLYYYENKSSTHEKGKIDVVDAQRISTWFDISTAERKLPNGLSPDRAFAIVCHDRTYTCVCEIDGESQSWINALNKARGGEQQYPPPTNPTETPTSPKHQSATFEAPPPYTPTANPPPAVSAASPVGASGPQMPQPQNYGGLPPPIGQPYPQGSGTLPRQSAGPPPPQPIPRCNSYNPPTSAPNSGSYAPPPPAAGARAPPPPGGPGYAHNYPVGSYRPPPNPGYYPPRAPAGYPPPAAPVRYPPQSAYPPRPPPAAAYPPRPPPSAYPPRPQPAVYRPPPAPAPYQPPLRPGGYQYRPPMPVQQQYRPVQMQQAATNVTVINLAAPGPTTRIVYR